jgi:hypothetical protein
MMIYCKWLLMYLRKPLFIKEGLVVIFSDYLNTKLRLDISSKLFSPGSDKGFPNGICAMSFHSDAIFHSVFTASSINSP